MSMSVTGKKTSLTRKWQVDLSQNLPQPLPAGRQASRIGSPPRVDPTLSKRGIEGDFLKNIFIPALSGAFGADLLNLGRSDCRGVIPPACPLVVDNRSNLPVGQLAAPGGHIHRICDTADDGPMSSEKDGPNVIVRVRCRYHRITRKRRKKVGSALPLFPVATCALLVINPSPQPSRRTSPPGLRSSSTDGRDVQKLRRMIPLPRTAVQSEYGDKK